MNTNEIARIASLLGEPARAGMLLELIDGRALTANELARAGHVQPPTASRHLALLVENGLLVVEQRGRHRYHRLAGPAVAKAVEDIMQLAAVARPAAPRRVVTGPRDAEMRRARSCYDHIAGRLGVAITGQLLAGGGIELDEDSGTVTPQLAHAMGPLGEATSRADAALHSCRPCLDWSERRPHLAGKLGRWICAQCLERGWLTRKDGSRALTITPLGERQFRGWLGSEAWQAVQAPA